MRYIYTSPPARVVAPASAGTTSASIPGTSGRAAFVARIESDPARYDQVIRRTGIRVEQ
jgi:hypothetical protein